MPRTKRADLQCNNAIGAAQERRSSGLIYLFENIVRKWRRRFSRSEWALRRLRLSPASGPSSEPGLLLIQIDGLSRDQMERAMVRGRLPFLRSLQQRQHYELTTFYSGLPSTTPAVQAELFYGVCCAVPAFSFLDRPTKRIATMYKPDWVKKVEADLQKQCTGLLAGGSSWSNIYTGGAALEESHFCAASIGPGDFLKSVSWWGLLSIILLHFPAVLRLLFLLVMEIFLALWDVMRGVWAGENFYQEIKFILSRLFVGVGLRELVTIGAAVDLARGLPIVHVNFLGYDEQSHRRGPDSAFAHWSLKGIDFAIKKLYIEAQRSHRREYRVWIFSDHGQERVRSFYEEFPGGIERVMHEALTQAPPPQGRRTRGSMRMSRADWMGDRRARRRLERAQKEESLSVEEETLFSVTALGPVGHVYLGQKTSVDEKLALAKWLVNRGGVPGVLMALSPAGGLWVHSKGVWRLPEEAREHLPHPGRLKDEIARDLLRLCTQELSGDLVLLGWKPQGQPWTFAFERGAHGGPGKHEVTGFALLPARTRLPEHVSEFIRPDDLRRAALHLLKREMLPSRKRAIELSPSLRLRVMTYNVHSCIGMDGKISPHRIARVIDLYNPDLVALQEIDLGRARTRGHDQARMIAEELDLNVAFCPTVIKGQELYGHALLSRFPLEVIASGKLSGGPSAILREPRGALLGRVEMQGETIFVLNTHLGLGRMERVSQIADLTGPKWIGGIPIDHPLILCGDFNMLPGSFPYRALAARLKDVQMTRQGFRPLKTFTAAFPFSRIDHIFTSAHFDVESVQVPQTHLTRIASDHLPLVVDLWFKPVSSLASQAALAARG